MSKRETPNTVVPYSPLAFSPSKKHIVRWLEMDSSGATCWYEQSFFDPDLTLGQMLLVESGMSEEER